MVFLLRSAARYGEQWRKFLEPWRERGSAPRPHLFEVDFGLTVTEGATAYGPLVIRTAEVEVRVSGRIDRVDLVPLADGVGFWIIDYKTGRSEHYTGADLREFRKLQLTLYALAVEEVLLAGQGARPLGLAFNIGMKLPAHLAATGKAMLAHLDPTAVRALYPGTRATALPRLAGDPNRLQQIFNNLVGNAVKYTQAEGKVKVSVERLDRNLRFMVKDNGMGISPEDQAHIFDRFYRVRRPETENIEGTGLGLAIVKKLIEAHKGQIGLESSLGEGTTCAMLAILVSAQRDSIFAQRRAQCLTTCTRGVREHAVELEQHGVDHESKS